MYLKLFLSLLCVSIPYFTIITVLGTDSAETAKEKVNIYQNKSKEKNNKIIQRQPTVFCLLSTTYILVAHKGVKNSSKRMKTYADKWDLLNWTLVVGLGSVKEKESIEVQRFQT